MTIAAVPPAGIDVARVAPPADAAAAGFEDMLAGAQAKAPTEPRDEPAVDTAAERPVRTAPRDATKTTKDAKDATDTDVDATEAGDGTTEQPAADATDSDVDATDAAPVVVAPIVVAPVLPDSGVGQIILAALAELDGTLDSKAEVAVVGTEAEVPDVATMSLPFATEAVPETATPTTDIDIDVPVDETRMGTTRDADAETVVVVADDTPVSGTTPEHHGRAPEHAARDGARDAMAPVTTDDRSRPVASHAGETRDAPVAAPATVAAVEAPPVTPASTPADDNRGPSQNASPIAIAAVAAHEMPAVSRGAEVSAMHTANVPVSAPPAEQLVSVLRPLRTSPDGSYRIRLELRPPELGRVELRVEMRDGVLSASLHTDNEGAATTLQNALGDLRARLEATGVRAGSLSVDDGRAGERQAHRDAPRDRGNETINESGVATTPDPTTASTSDGVLDVRL